MTKSIFSQATFMFKLQIGFVPIHNWHNRIEGVSRTRGKKLNLYPTPEAIFEFPTHPSGKYKIVVPQICPASIPDCELR